MKKRQGADVGGNIDSASLPQGKRYQNPGLLFNNPHVYRCLNSSQLNALARREMGEGFVNLGSVVHSFCSVSWNLLVRTPETVRWTSVRTTAAAPKSNRTTPNVLPDRCRRDYAKSTNHVGFADWLCMNGDGEQWAEPSVDASGAFVGEDANAAGVSEGFPPVGWMTNRQTAERLGIGIETLVTNWKYRDTLKAAAQTTTWPTGGRCNLYPAELVERIAAEREAASRAVVPDGFVDGDRAAEMLGIKRQSWNAWLSKGIVRLEHITMAGAGGVSRRKLYAVADVERVCEELKAAGKLFVGVDELGPGKWLTINEAAAVAGVAVRTWDIWSKSGRVPEGVWVKGPMGQPTQMWREAVAVKARTPETGDGTWVTTEESLTILRTTKQTLAEWVREKRVPAGVQGKSNGSFAMLWRAEELRGLRAEWDARPFPPEGYVDRQGAYQRLGIGPATLDKWVRDGRFPYEGELMARADGSWCRVYEIARLDAAREQMRIEDAERVAIPEGWVDADGAAALLGISPLTVYHWAKEKKIPRAKPWKLLRGARQHIFKVDGLEAARERMRLEALRPAAPEGFIDLHEAAASLDVSAGTFAKWERSGRLAEGKVVPIPGTSARTKIYPRAAIEQLRETIRTEIENFPPAGWLEMTAAAWRAKVSVPVFKKWIMDGRVESGRYVSRPTMARCKIFSIEEIDRLVAECGRDHEFYLEPDGNGGWQIPAGYVDRDGAAAMFGVATSTFVHWQSDGRITCGRWARVPSEHATIGVNGRRVYPVEALRPLVAEFEQHGKPYIDPNDSGIARVPIMSWSKTRGEAIIDAADLPLIEGMRFNLMDARPDDGAGAVVVRSGPSGEQTPLRRLLLGLRGTEHRYSHRNGDPLDCRRANIVVKTHNEQQYGTRKRRSHLGQPCTSRFKGVSWVKGAWQVQIQKEGQRVKIGRFEDEIAAAQAYDEKAIELFGEFARINFPNGVDAWLETEYAEKDEQQDEGRIAA
jgi:predicted site-specific integrase-resolvase